MRLSYFELSQNHFLDRDRVISVEGTEERHRLHHKALGANQALANARKVVLRSKDSLACFRDIIGPAHNRRHKTFRAGRRGEGMAAL